MLLGYALRSTEVHQYQVHLQSRENRLASVLRDPLLLLAELPLVRPLLVLVPLLHLSLMEVRLPLLVLAPPLQYPSELLLVLVLSPVQVVLPFAVI